MADSSTNWDVPRQIDEGDQTCMSSITGFDFELHPESGRMYPMLASVPSDAVSYHTTRANHRSAETLPGLHEAATLAGPHRETDELEASTGRMEVVECILDLPDTNSSPATGPKLTRGQMIAQQTKSSEDQPKSKLIEDAQTMLESHFTMLESHFTDSDAVAVAPAKISFVGLNQKTLEEDTREIQAMANNHCPGAYHLQGILEQREEEDVEEDQQEDEVQVQEAHLVVADDFLSLESARVTPAKEVLECQVIKSRVQEEGNGQGKPIVWGLMAISFLGALLVLLVVLLVEPANDTQENETWFNTTQKNMVTTAPTTQTMWYPPFLDDIPVQVINGIERNMDSPFYKANFWIWNDPNMDSYSPERLKQRFFLVMMYHATNGDRWLRKDNWLSYEVSECDWFSHSTFPADSKYYEPNVCQDSNDTLTVINLSLASNNLTGYWPIYYHAFIPLLRIFDVGNNHIGGVLPTFTTTPYLEVYIVSNNAFQGAYSFNAGAYWGNIKVLRADGAETRGNNGGAMFDILGPGLEIYNITGMSNDGQLWAELGTRTSLEYCGNGHSNISGTIPTEFGLLTSLKELDLSSLPFLSGTIPSELGLLTDLTLLDLAETPISGTVPIQLCDRVQAGLLEIAANCSLLQCCNDT